MAVTEQQGSEMFIRPDGKEKVTGSGRYTADLNLTGPGAREVPLRGPPARPHHAARHDEGPRAARRVRRAHARGRARRALRRDRPGPPLFAKEAVRCEGDIVAAVAALTPEIAEQAAALIEVDYEPLPSVNDVEAALDGRRAARARGLGELRGRRGHRRATATCSGLDDRQGRRRRRDAEPGRRSSSRPLRRRRLARRADRAARDRRAVAGRPGHGLDLDARSPFDARSGVAHTLALPESNVRIIVPLLGGGFGAKCDFHFEAHVAALARAAGRPVKLVFSRREEFIAPDHRREGMVIELETGVRDDGTLVARRGTARTRQRRLLRRGRVLRADGGDAR